RRVRDRQDAAPARDPGADAGPGRYPRHLRGDRGGCEDTGPRFHLCHAGHPRRRGRCGDRVRTHRADREVLRPPLRDDAAGDPADGRTQSTLITRERSSAAAIDAAIPARTPCRSTSARASAVVPAGLVALLRAMAACTPVSWSTVAAPRTVCCTRVAARSRASPCRTDSSIMDSISAYSRAGIDPAAAMKAWT